jgi:hypothetical protein
VQGWVSNVVSKSGLMHAHGVQNLGVQSNTIFGDRSQNNQFDTGKNTGHFIDLSLMSFGIKCLERKSEFSSL